MASVRIVSTAILLAASALGAPSPAAPGAARDADPPLPGSAVEGAWAAVDGPGQGLHFTLQWETTTWGVGAARGELRGLSEAQVASAAPTAVSFRIEREPGALQMEGSFSQGKGDGRFRFQPDPGFARTLASLGVRGAEQATGADLMFLALGRVTTTRVREFASLELGGLALRDVVSLAQHGVTPDYVREVRSLGLEGTSTVAGVVELRLHRITRGYLRELEAAGYRDLPRRQLLQMGLHGVGRAQVQALAEAGYRDLAPDQLVRMRMHRVTPEFIREMREAGLRDLTPEALVALRLHRISGEYVRELRTLGFGDLSRAQLLRMGIYGVTPGFIREVRRAGFTDLSPETLVRMKIHGIGPELAEQGERGGQ